MAIQPVKYKNDSSTAGFAEAGDTIAITSNNANTIKKDVDQGNTESLNNAQQRWLDKWVDQDTLDYSDEEMQKVGENQIDTKGEDGEDLSEKDQKAGSNAAVAGAAAGAVGGAIAAATAAYKAPVLDGFSDLVLGGIVTGLGVANIALSLPGVFDSNLGERENQTNNAAGNNSLLQQYTDKMNADMDSMTEESGTYAELSEMQTQITMDSITNVGALQAEMQVYQAQGNTEKVAELKAEIEKLQGESEKELEEPQKNMETIKGNLEQYTGNNAEAQGVASSGSTVSTFLQAGEPMSKKAKACAALQMVASLACIATVIYPKIWTPFGPVDGAPAGIAKILFVAGGLSFGIAANTMLKNADSEGAAADAGDEMSGFVASLNENIEGQAGFTEEATAGYLENDEKSAETTDKTQKETDKANQKQGQALAAQTKPEEDKPEEEKPVVAAGGGDGGAGAAGGAAA